MAMMAYTKSDREAPIAVAMPEALPLFSVRCKQRTAIGPTGADAISPISNPFRKIDNMVQISAFLSI